MIKTNPLSCEKGTRGKYLTLFSIIFIAIIIRFACFLYYQAHSGIQTFEYETVAENIIQGKGFMLDILNTVQRAPIAPLYPAACALIYFLFGHHHFLIVFLQIALNAATCAMVFFLVKRFFDSKCAYLAAILIALHPGLIIYSSTKLHPLTLYSFLICSSFFLLATCLKGYGMRHKILLGLCTGFCVLERATFLPFFVLAWFWLFCYSENKKEAKKIILISIVSLLLIVLPWTIRNTLIFKRFVFIQTNQWWGFWLGNNPQSSGTSTVALGKSAIEANPEEFRQKLLTLDEIGQMDFFRIAALNFVRQHPRQFISRTAKKFYYFWWFSPQSGLRYPSFYLKWYKMYYTFILPVSLIGIICALSIKKARPIIILILLLFSSNSLLHSIYYVDGRHRWSIEPLLLICFSFGLFQILHYLLSILQNAIRGNLIPIFKKAGR